MHPTTDRDPSDLTGPSDPSRTGALWVAGTGAFLLFAAAVVFVAVRWSDIPEGVKLAALATLTASLLVAGRLARSALPATATALFHLGAFLLPVNVAAALVRAPVDTGWVLVATGAVGALGLGIGARLERSPVLVAGAGLSAVVLAAGVGDLSGVPALATVLPAATLTGGTTALAIRPRPGTSTAAEVLTCASVAVSLVIPIATAVRIAGEVSSFVLLVGLAVTAWALGAALDRTQSDTFPALGDLPRIASLGVLLPAMFVLDEAQGAVLATGLALAAIVEAIRLGRPRLVVLSAVALPVAAVAGAIEADLAIDEAGLAATMAAIVPLGLAGVVSDRWRSVTLLNAATIGGLGLALASFVPSTGATALLVAGGALLAAGGLLGLPVFVGAGGAAASLGYWMHLDLAHVQAADAYVLPVAVALLAVGAVAERRRVASSWFTLTPPILLLGGTALIERVSGGSGAHALVVGLVGAAAVLVGGRAQLLGPVVTGTVLLVALTTYETLAITAGVPTWAWLAVGGTVLLLAGLAMDRADTGPVETGRRVADVVGERFH